jgi:photosystem II stability/assembly factor-like uncharacterized protein
MADRHDVDDWLAGRVDPLPPPPGTFDLIKRRARRRKYRKLALATGAAAVIVAAGVTVPQVVNLPVLNPATVAARGAGHASQTATGPGGAASFSATPFRGSQPPVPPNFRPTSVTFIGTHTGWVIGQAGTPGRCATAFCTSVARTDDAGTTWSGSPAPVTGPPDGSTGVSQVRFLNLADGWAFGPQLWATHDGGQIWTQVDTHGLRVTDLETVGDRAFAVFAACSGSGSAFAAGCTGFTLYSSPAAGDDWTPVGAATSGLTSSGGSPGAAASASLVLTGRRGYLLAPTGQLYAGPVDGSGPWTLVQPIPGACTVGPPQSDGQPTGALLGAVNAQNLILVCASVQAWADPAVDTQPKTVYSSANGGVSWAQLATAPSAGFATSVAASPTESVLLATDQGMDLLPAGGTRWQTATLGTAAPAGGFSYVGMTTALQGVALPADASSGTVWFTFDGGRSWLPSRLDGS